MSPFMRDFMLACSLLLLFIFLFASALSRADSHDEKYQEYGEDYGTDTSSDSYETESGKIKLETRRDEQGRTRNCTTITVGGQEFVTCD